MKKAIVTGATGFVGAALCKELLNHGYEVIAITRKESRNTNKFDGLRNLRLVFCDLSEIIHLDELIADRDLDIFFHFAWNGSAGALRGNYEAQINNLRYTCEAVEACSKIGCKKFVFASSIMEYEILKLMETHDIPGINTLYNSAKLASNFMARTLAGHYGIEYVRTVISNIYGPGEESPRLINSSLRKLLKGEHCSFSAGEQSYDFIYITDAVKAILAVAETGHNNKAYYIGTTPMQLKTFLEEMKNQVDPKIKIGLGELPFNGVLLSYDEFDLNAVKNDTGFIPLVPFDEGIRKTIEWIKENG